MGGSRARIVQSAMTLENKRGRLLKRWGRRTVKRFASPMGDERQQRAPVRMTSKSRVHSTSVDQRRQEEIERAVPVEDSEQGLGFLV